MMTLLSNKFFKKGLILLASLSCIFFLAGQVFADITINILAVNGTDKIKEKDINYVLPQELTAEDILDTNGLKLNYDVEKGAYSVSKKVSLKAKETKTFKIRIRDVWTIDQKEINDIKTQASESLQRLKDTEYYSVGKIREDALLKRLNFIAEQQEKYADNVKKRIDSFRIYEDELKDIRNDAVSVDYWKSKPPEYGNDNLVTFIIEAKNPSDTKTVKYEHKHYLPPEVKPEHLVEAQGFDMRYDPIKKQSYLVKEDEFKPGETKKYQISIVDVWKIKQQEIENLKDNTRDIYKFLKNTRYENSALYLVESIKKDLGEIEFSQSLEKNINEHISSFSRNKELFARAKQDLESLENLLRAVRANLERSKLKNVLDKLKSFKSIVELAKSIFKKPEVNTAWKIITGIVIGVGIFTMAHFIIWGKRSKDIKIEEEKEEKE